MNCSIGPIGVAIAFVSGVSACAAPPPITFEADVRPILKAHCFQCHGESGAKEGQLDLRLRRWMVEGGESGPAIVSGKPTQSRLLERIRNGEMPPEGKNPLAANDIDAIEKWIADGAPTARPERESLGDEPTYTDEERNWWAFRPVVRPAVPRVTRMSDVSTPIDAFLLARLEEAAGAYPDRKAAFQFAPPAPRSVLIRRATFDLLGLPPSPEDMAQFESDDRPDAWERLVDRLLASPHYGERWGRHWLDVAGYADSEGYTDEDQVRPYAFHYRDYVIRSFNADRPFDQFVIEQLAGDELVQPASELTADAVEKLTATAFLRMAPDGTASGGIDQNLARNQVMADTLQIVGTSLLGLTVNCAQCHDHRYDPISQVDYYRLRAIFEPALGWKNWKTPPARRVSLYTAAERAQRTQIEAEAKQVDAERRKVVEHYITRTLEQELLLAADEKRDELRTAYRTAAGERTPEQKQLLSEHPSIANISEGALYLYERRRSARLKDIETRRAEKQLRFIAETTRRELEKLPAEIRGEVEAALKTAAEQRTPQQAELLQAHANVVVTPDSLAKVNPEAAAELDLYTQAAEEIRTTNIKEHLQTFTDRAAEIRAKIPPEDFLRALTETPGQVPPTFVFHRGDHEQPRQQVPASGLAVLGLETELPDNDPELPTTGRRLAFARSLTNGKHPLVARVIVNRIWMHHFGLGLVNSPGDFGRLGERPTHPELLDWLAAEFVHSGWSVKHLHRLIMTSAAYRRSSAADPQLVEADPENRLYARMPVRRLESEVLRDAILFISGTLNDKLFGQPVPVMEDEVGQIVIGRENLDGERKPSQVISLDGEEFRRSVYVQVRRSRPLAVLETFDSPEMTPNCDRRASSNVAPQSLLFMNSRFTVEFAERFAERLLAEAPDDARAQVARGWRLAFGRAPSDEDVAAAIGFLTAQQQAIVESTAKISDDEGRRRALATFCQALLSSNRFLYVE